VSTSPASFVEHAELRWTLTAENTPAPVAPANSVPESIVKTVVGEQPIGEVKRARSLGFLRFSHASYTFSRFFRLQKHH
jgi:hypothetical protein